MALVVNLIVRISARADIQYADLIFAVDGFMKKLRLGLAHFCQNILAEDENADFAQNSAFARGHTGEMVSKFLDFEQIRSDFEVFCKPTTFNIEN